MTASNKSKNYISGSDKSRAEHPIRSQCPEAMTNCTGYRLVITKFDTKSKVDFTYRKVM
jgi:hypothetical protein